MFLKDLLMSKYQRLMKLLLNMIYMKHASECKRIVLVNSVLINYSNEIFSHLMDRVSPTFYSTVSIS